MTFALCPRPINRWAKELLAVILRHIKASERDKKDAKVIGRIGNTLALMYLFGLLHMPDAGSDVDHKVSLSLCPSAFPPFLPG